MKKFPTKTAADMTNEQKIQALKDAAEEVNAKIKLNYTGSNCFKNPCLAAYCDNIVLFVEAAAIRGVRGGQSDFTGRSCVVYYPQITNQSKQKTAVSV